MRWVGILARVVGWLLTPLVAWAASFSGAWVVLRGQAGFEEPRRALYTALALGFAFALVALLAWIELLRRSPRLRHSLHVTREGLPDLEEPPDPPPPPEAPTT